MSIYQDYGYGYGSSYDPVSTGFGILTGFFTYFIVMLIMMLVVSIVMCIAQWKIFKKVGKPGWYSLIPIFNMWMFLEISGLHGWLALIPFANGIAMLIACYKLAIKFGKSTGFAVCTIFFSVVCLPIIAFDKSTYGGSNNTVNSSNVNNDNNYIQPMSNVSVNVQQQYQSFDSNIGMNSQQELNNIQMNNSSVYSQNVEQPLNLLQSANQPVVDNNSNSVNLNQSVQSSMKVCSSCQNLNPSTSSFCVKCGNKL